MEVPMKSMILFLVSLMTLATTAAHAKDGECFLVDDRRSNNVLSYHFEDSKSYILSEMVKKGYTIVKSSEAPADAIWFTDAMESFTRGESPINKMVLYVEMTLPDYRVFVGSYSEKVAWFSSFNYGRGLKEMVGELPDCKDL